MESIIYVIQIIIIVLIISFSIGIVFFLAKSRGFRQNINVLGFKFSKKIKAVEYQYEKIIRRHEIVRQKWKNLSEKVKSGNERDLRLAIIEADILVDEVLIEHGHPGKDMGERLKSINKNEIENLNDLWEAHKIRNKIVHETEFHISTEEAKKTINTYGKTLKNLLSREIEPIQDAL